MCRKAVSCKKNLPGDGFLIGKGSIRVTSLAAQPSCCKSGDVKSRYKMRITFPCPDFKGYLENPIIFLPEKVNCVRNPAHCTHRNGHWQRQIAVDYVSTTTMSLYRLYCLDCGESISLWPEFVLPYQREPVETHEQVLVEYVAGKPFTELAEKLGYDARSIARWVRRMVQQTLFLAPRLIPEMMKAITGALLPLGIGSALSVVTHVLAWLHQYAQFIGFTRYSRLIGLANLLRQGQWIIWGGEVGRCRYGRECYRASPGLPPSGGR